MDFATDSLDAVVSVGVLTVGHTPASSLAEMVRTTKLDRHSLFTLRPDIYESNGFKEKQATLES